MSKSDKELPMLTRQAYDALHSDILSGVLEAGSRLRISALKERYNIGPTPIREALARLSAIGFIQSEKNRGFSIPELTLTELRDVTNQRKLIEVRALRLSIESHSDDFEADLVAAYHRLARLDDRMRNNGAECLIEWEDRHREFHEVLIQGARSPCLSRFQAILYDQADRYRRFYIPHTSLPKGVFDDHKRLLEATLARDVEKACDLMDMHIERVYKIAAKSGLFP